jgi:hypothetical protein
LTTQLIQRSLPANDSSTSLPTKLRSESPIVDCLPLPLSLSFGAGPPAPEQNRGVQYEW